MDNDSLEKRLVSFVTKDELEARLASQKSASEQFLDDHDRNFRTIERQVDTAVSNLNTGLSKLNIMSDALSQVMRVHSDNYEAQRASSTDHETRISRLELQQSDMYDSIFGNAQHPDRESLIGMHKKRSQKADEQHEETFSKRCP